MVLRGEGHVVEGLAAAQIRVPVVVQLQGDEGSVEAEGLGQFHDAGKLEMVQPGHDAVQHAQAPSGAQMLRPVADGLKDPLPDPFPGADVGLAGRVRGVQGQGNVADPGLLDPAQQIRVVDQAVGQDPDFDPEVREGPDDLGQIRSQEGLASPQGDGGGAQAAQVPGHLPDLGKLQLTGSVPDLPQPAHPAAQVASVGDPVVHVHRDPAGQEGLGQGQVSHGFRVSRCPSRP